MHLDVKEVLKSCIHKNNRLVFKKKALTSEIDNRKILISQKKDKVLKVQEELERLAKKIPTHPPTRLSGFYLQKLISVTHDRSVNHFDPQHKPDLVKLSKSMTINDTSDKVPYSKKTEILLSPKPSKLSPYKETSAMASLAAITSKAVPSKPISQSSPEQKKPKQTPYFFTEGTELSTPRHRFNSGNGLSSKVSIGSGQGSGSARTITQSNIQANKPQRLVSPQSFRMPQPKRGDDKELGSEEGMFDKLNKWLLNKVTLKGSQQ